MDNEERLARMYYAAYGALCHTNDMDFTQDEESRLRLFRDILHAEYHKYNRDTQYEMYDRTGINDMEIFKRTCDEQIATLQAEIKELRGLLEEGLVGTGGLIHDRECVMWRKRVKTKLMDKRGQLPTNVVGSPNE